jgi:hypothetical protein
MYSSRLLHLLIAYLLKLITRYAMLTAMALASFTINFKSEQTKAEQGSSYILRS